METMFKDRFLLWIELIGVSKSLVKFDFSFPQFWKQYFYEDNSTELKTSPIGTQNTLRQQPDGPKHVPQPPTIDMLTMSHSALYLLTAKSINISAWYLHLKKHLPKRKVDGGMNLCQKLERSSEKKLQEKRAAPV